MPGGQFLELLLLKWSDFDNSKIAAGHFTHNYGLDRVSGTSREHWLNAAGLVEARISTNSRIVPFNVLLSSSSFSRCCLRISS